MVWEENSAWKIGSDGNAVGQAVLSPKVMPQGSLLAWKFSSHWYQPSVLGTSQLPLPSVHPLKPQAREAFTAATSVMKTMNAKRGMRMADIGLLVGDGGGEPSVADLWWRQFSFHKHALCLNLTLLCHPEWIALPGHKCPAIRLWWSWEVLMF